MYNKIKSHYFGQFFRDRLICWPANFKSKWNVNTWHQRFPLQKFPQNIIFNSKSSNLKHIWQTTQNKIMNLIIILRKFCYFTIIEWRCKYSFTSLTRPFFMLHFLLIQWLNNWHWCLSKSNRINKLNVI